MATIHPIRAALADDRRRLGELIAAFEAAHADPTRAAAAFAALARGVRGHLRRQDELILAGLTGEVAAAALASVRREHAPLRALLAEIEQDLRRSRSAGVRGNTRELAAALALHLRHVEALLPVPAAAPAP